MRRFVYDHALALLFGGLFVGALVGQAFAGYHEFNNQLHSDGLSGVSFGYYLTSSDFAVDVAENWQSEFLQFFLYIFATVWLVQRGSPESKEPGEEGLESDAKQEVGASATKGSPSWARRRGWRLRLYSHSLGLTMALIFLLSWLAQSVAGVSAYNQEQLRQLEAPVDWSSYVVSADFWSRTLQNWQSEFLAILSMVVLSIYLRERGSPESKPVGVSHSATGVEG